MKGMLMKPDMHLATRELRKTVTRRVCYGQRELSNIHDFPVRNARYQVGEVVYIKEAWAISSAYDFSEPSDEMIKGDPTVPIHFMLDGEKPEWCGRVRSPMHLLAVKARSFIKITDARAERLQEITYGDCMAEGINMKDVEYRPYWDVSKFKVLWNSINKEYPWESNPLVWRYEFRICHRSTVGEME